MAYVEQSCMYVTVGMMQAVCAEWPSNKTLGSQDQSVVFNGHFCVRFGVVLHERSPPYLDMGSHGRHTVSSSVEVINVK